MRLWWLLLASPVWAEPQFELRALEARPLYSLEGDSPSVSGPEVAVVHAGQLEIHRLQDGSLLRTQPLAGEWSFNAGRVVTLVQRTLSSSGWSVKLPFKPLALSLDPQGRVWLAGERELRWLDGASGRLIRRYPVKTPGTITSVSSPHGSNQVIFSAGWGRNGGAEYALDLDSGKSGVLMQHGEDSDDLTRLSFSGDASVAVVSHLSLPADGRFELSRVEHLGADGMRTVPLLSVATSSASEVASSGPWVAYSYGDWLEVLNLTKGVIFRLAGGASRLGFGAQHRLVVERSQRVDVYDPAAFFNEAPVRTP